MPTPTSRRPLRGALRGAVLSMALVSPGLMAHAQSVTGFLLIDAAADAPIGSLADGATVDLDAVGDQLSIEASVSGTVGSVVFALTGAETESRSENVAPYTLFGDIGTPPVDYVAWEPTLGTYTLTATAYDGPSGSGTAGTPLSITFTVTGTPPPPPPATGGEFVEAGGLIVIEAESNGVVGDWDLNTTVTGFTGTGYIEWQTGDFATSTDPAGSDPITYEILVSNPGRYRFLYRTASPNATEYNDVWARFPDNPVFREKAGVFSTPVFGADSWFKIYQNDAGDAWTWETKHVDFDPHDIYVDFPAPGVYRFQFSGRSSRFKIDRFVIYDEAQVSFGTATNPSTPESPRAVMATCDVPANPTTEVLADTVARLTWDAVAEADGYELQGRPLGASVWRGTKTGGTGGALNLFRPGRSYEWRVRAGCLGLGDTSDFTAMQTFTMPSSLEALGLGLAAEDAAWTPVPNPAAARVTLQGAVAGWTAEAWDVTGRLVARQRLDGAAALDVSGWPAGLYRLRLQDADGADRGQRGLVVRR